MEAHDAVRRAVPMKGGANLFDRLVSVSGLPSLIAAASLQRAIGRVGVDPSQMTRADLDRAMPMIEKALRLYLPREEVDQRLEALRRL
jgi:hypothetical protein